MTRHELAGAGLVVLWAIVWAAAILGARLDVVWLELGAAVLLLLGTAIIFVALARMDRPLFPGRRPAGANAGKARCQASPFPSRADVVHGPTGPPPAGGRAFSFPKRVPVNGRPRLLTDLRLLDEDLEALRRRRRPM